VGQSLVWVASGLIVRGLYHEELTSQDYGVL
jgi:hypothetical protein